MPETVGRFCRVLVIPCPPEAARAVCCISVGVTPRATLQLWTRLKP
jgi:hypothetical protein